MLPARFAHWFESRGWRPHAHQLEMLRAAADGASALLIAPTERLTGFLSSMLELDRHGGEHAIVVLLPEYPS